MSIKLYCPIIVDGVICGNTVATKQVGKFRPDKIHVKCNKCGKYLTYNYITDEFYITKKYHPQDSSGKRFY